MKLISQHRPTVSRTLDLKQENITTIIFGGGKKKPHTNRKSSYGIHKTEITERFSKQTLKKSDNIRIEGQGVFPFQTVELSNYFLVQMGSNWLFCGLLLIFFDLLCVTLKNAFLRELIFSLEFRCRPPSILQLISIWSIWPNSRGLMLTFEVYSYLDYCYIWGFLCVFFFLLSSTSQKFCWDINMK